MTQHQQINHAQYTQQKQNTNKIKPNVEQYNNQRTINDKMLFKKQKRKISTTIKLYSYFVRRTNNKEDRNNKNKINTSKFLL